MITKKPFGYGDVNVVNEIANEMGIAVDAKTTALMTAGFDVPFPAQLTMREVLSNIAGLYGGCFVISDTNTLLLRCLWDVSDTAEVAARTAGWDEKPKCSSSTDIPAFPACTGLASWSGWQKASLAWQMNFTGSSETR